MLSRNRITIPSAFSSGLPALAAGLAVVAKSAGDLLGQAVVQGIDQAADVLADVGTIQVLPPAVAGIEDLPQISQDFDEFAIAGQGAVAEMMDRPHSS